MSYRHAREIFGKAARRLQSGKGALEDRLLYTGKELAALQDGELPIEMRSDFRALYAEFNTQRATGNEGTIAATVAKLSPQEAEALSNRVLAFARRVG